MTNTKIIGIAFRQALAGESITDTETLGQALRETMGGTDFHFVGLEAVGALLEYVTSDIQAQRQVVRAQINAAKGN